MNEKLLDSSEPPEETKHERALRSVDPRKSDPRYLPRMRMLADEPPSTAERGCLLDHFIDPDD